VHEIDKHENNNNIIIVKKLKAKAQENDLVVFGSLTIL
jgi:hypothetical protein